MSIFADRLAELSEKVGKQTGSLDGLNNSFDRHCDDDDRRHHENVEALKRAHGENIDNFREVFAELRKITEKLEPVAGLTKDVAEMKPHVEDYKTFRKQLALVAVGVSAIAGGAVSLIWYAATHLGEFGAALKSFMSK